MSAFTIASLLANGTAQLADGVEWVREEAAREAELLLTELLRVTRTQLRLRVNDAVPAALAARYQDHLARRANGEPIAYILGEREFWSLPLRVGPGVLVPRPDTECLVEVALRFLQGQATVSVLDLGTGSGAIALALASELPTASYAGGMLH